LRWARPTPLIRLVGSKPRFAYSFDVVVVFVERAVCLWCLSVRPSVYSFFRMFARSLFRSHPHLHARPYALHTLQYHKSNWFHPLGFAYYPDKIGGQNPTCADAGDTGLVQC
jgi:hypothetical protein